jgi:hypothetical protein
MKTKLIAVAILATMSGAQAQNEPWAMPVSAGTPRAVYDPATGPLPPDRRYMLTREGYEAVRYEALNPGAFAQAQPAQPVTVATSAQPSRSAGRNYHEMPQAPARAVVQAPEWFVNLPADTLDLMFAAGAASSVDEQMAYDKARMHAERKLVEAMGAQIRSLTKSHRNDQGDSMIETFEQTIQKSANGTLIGAQRVDSQTTFDGRQYKVYVLLRYPLGENNVLRKERLNSQNRREAELRSARAHQELDTRLQTERTEQREDQAQQRQELGPKPEPAPASTAPPVTAPTNNGEIKLLDVDNAEYKQRRDAALQKPGAVVGQTVVR